MVKFAWLPNSRVGVGLNFINQVRMRYVGVVTCTPYLHFFSILALVIDYVAALSLEWHIFGCFQSSCQSISVSTLSVRLLTSR